MTVKETAARRPTRHAGTRSTCYSEEPEVHSFNLVAFNTREGRVLNTLLRELELMGRSLGDPVDVIGEIFADYRLSDLLEDVLAGTVTPADAVSQFGTDPDEFAPRRVRPGHHRACPGTPPTGSGD